jgi:hypothetical protein
MNIEQQQTALKNIKSFIEANKIGGDQQEVLLLKLNIAEKIASELLAEPKNESNKIAYADCVSDFLEKLKTAIEPIKVSQIIDSINIYIEPLKKAELEGIIARKTDSFITTGQELLHEICNGNVTINDFATGGKFGNLYQDIGMDEIREKHKETSSLLKAMSLSSMGQAVSGAVSSLFYKKDPNDPQLPENRTRIRNQLTAITCLSWAINDMSKYKQGTAMESGSFKIEDLDDKIYKFLLSYVKLVNGIDQDKPFDDTKFFSQNSLAYTREATEIPGTANRLSSHYHKGPHQATHQKGIDSRFYLTEEEIPMLPPDENGDYKRHVLFAHFDNKIFPQEDSTKANGLFFKIEEYGLGTMDSAIHHTVQFKKTRSTTGDAEKNKEKTVRQELKDIYKHFCIEANQLDWVEQKKTPICVMLANMDSKITETTDEAKKQLLKDIKSAFEGVATDKYHLDHLDLRYGQEIIITAEEIINYLYQYV